MILNIMSEADSKISQRQNSPSCALLFCSSLAIVPVLNITIEKTLCTSQSSLNIWKNINMSITINKKSDSIVNKRTAILNAAQSLFLEKGYDLTSMDVISKYAKVSKQTIYSYFNNKENLFLTVMEETCEYFPSEKLDINLQKNNLKEALTDFSEQYINQIFDNNNIKAFRLIISEISRFPELGKLFYNSGYFRKSVKIIEKLLLKESSLGNINIESPGLAAEHFLSLLRGDEFFKAVLGLSPWSSDAQVKEHIRQTIITFLNAYKK